MSCLECGACCFADGPRYLRVSGDDHRRLGPGLPSLTHFIGNRCYMRLVDGHCVALTVPEPGSHWVCKAYAIRPGVCRDLERGSPQCLAEFERKHGRASSDPVSRA